MYNYETLKILLNSRDFSHVRFTTKEESKKIMEVEYE